MKNTFKSLAVYCGSNPGTNPEYTAEAYRVGQFLATHAIKLIYGAGRIGLMGEVAKGLLENGGEAVGVVPRFLKHENIVHPGLNELIVTETMPERKQVMFDRSEGFIILPGGFGTMEEFFEVLSWAQLALHQKPIGVLNVAGFYDDLLQLFKTMTTKGLLKKENLSAVLVAETIDELYLKMQNYTPVITPKWFTKKAR